MKNAQEYIETSYGTAHFAEVVGMQDAVSLFGLMNEYADYILNETIDEAKDIITADSSEGSKLNQLDGLRYKALNKEEQ